MSTLTRQNSVGKQYKIVKQKKALRMERLFCSVLFPHYTHKNSTDYNPLSVGIGFLIIFLTRYQRKPGPFLMFECR